MPGSSQSISLLQRLWLSKLLITKCEFFVLGPMTLSTWPLHFKNRLLLRVIPMSGTMVRLMTKVASSPAGCSRQLKISNLVNPNSKASILIRWKTREGVLVFTANFHCTSSKSYKRTSINLKGCPWLVPSLSKRRFSQLITSSLYPSALASLFQTSTQDLQLLRNHRGCSVCC